MFSSKEGNRNANQAGIEREEESATIQKATVKLISSYISVFRSHDAYETRRKVSK